MNSEYLFDKDGSDGEIERLESLLSEFCMKPVPPRLSRVSVEREASLFSRYKLVFALSFASLLVLFLAAGVLVSRLVRPEIPDRVELDSEVTNQELGNDPSVVYPLPVAATNPTRIVERSRKTKQSPQRIRRTPAPTTAEIAKDGTHLTPAELYAYQKLKVALFLAGSKMKIVQDTIDHVDDDQQKGKLNR